MTKPTWCSECDNVVADTRKRHPSQWLCYKFPRIEGGGFVAPKVWVEQEPYMRCVGINGGACPCFMPLPEGRWRETKVDGYAITTSVRPANQEGNNAAKSISE